MALPQAPRLDDRLYEDLRRELLRRIPMHSSVWTDHNPGDPGVALLELFAWLGENLLYRMNRVPERALLEFLRLLNLPPRPAQVAHTLVTFTLPLKRFGTTQPVVPELLRFGGADPVVTVSATGDVDFQVQDELEVLPVESYPVVKRPSSLAESGAVKGDENVLQLLEDHLEEAPEDFVTYHARPLEVPENGRLPDAVWLANSVDRSLWIALLAPEALVKGLEGTELEARMGSLRLAISGTRLSLGVWVDDALCGSEDHVECPAPGAARPRYPLSWQIATGRFRGASRSVDDPLYARLRVHSDNTGGLLRNGVVRLQIPDTKAGAAVIGSWTAESFDPPEPDLLGIGDMPPRLDDEKLAARVLTWVRCFRPEQEPGGEDYPDPSLRHIAANVVAVEQSATAPAEALGFGNGRTNQVVQLSRTPVLTKTVVIQVREGDDWVNWRRVDDLAVSRPNDPHYELEATSGKIRFGDGVNGRIPRPGEMIRCLSYRSGGGVRGNVPPAAIKRIKASGSLARLEVTNIFAANGGRDQETLEEAKRRIPKALRHRERAVAADDFAELARETPGFHVGRVEVLPRHKPHERLDEVPGVVTLIVLPAFDALHPDEPMPDRSMLRAVCEHLEFRRLVTTELYVTPPQYVPVWVSVAIEVAPDFGTATVERDVELAVRQYLAPLPPYGPGGKGWPFGRMLRDRDVEAAVLRVEGVRLVNDVRVEGTEINPQGATREVAQRVETRAWQLLSVRGVQVIEDEQAEAVDRTGDAGPVAPGKPGLPVPVEEEVC